MLAHLPHGGSHSSRPRIAPQLEQPTRAVDAKRTCPLARARRPYSALLRVGFAMRAALPKLRCALTAPFHPCLILSLANLSRPSAVCSLWHFPCGCPRRALPATLVSWSPDFPRTLRHAAARPPGGTRDRANRVWRQARHWPRARSPVRHIGRAGFFAPPPPPNHSISLTFPA